MGMKKACSCGYWNEEQQECLYNGSGCIRDDEKVVVTEKWKEEKAVELFNWWSAPRPRTLVECLSFIRSFVKEILGK